MHDPLLTALCYLCRYHGQPHSTELLLDGLPIEHGQLPPFLLPRAAQNVGLEAHEAQLSLPELSPLLLPAIALLRNNTACVVTEIDHKKKQAQISGHTTLEETSRPADDNYQEGGNTKSTGHWISFAELERAFINRVFLFKRPFQGDERSQQHSTATQTNHSPSSRWFWQTLWQSKAIYRDVLVASFLINLFAVATPLFTRLVYDKVVPNQAFDTLWVLASGIAIIFGFDLLLKGLRSYFLDISGKKADLLMSAAIYRKVMGIEMAARPPSVGAFARHLQEFESIREFFTSASLSALIDLPFALLFLAVIAYIAGPLAIIPAIAIALLALYSLAIQRPLRQAIEQGTQLSTQKNANLVESLAGLETLKLLNSQPQYQHRWEQAVATMAGWSVRSRRLADSVHNLAGFTQQAVSVGIIITGVYLIAAGQLSVGGLIAVSMLASRAIAPMIQLSQLSTRYFQAKTAVETLSAIMASPEEASAVTSAQSSVSQAGEKQPPTSRHSQQFHSQTTVAKQIGRIQFDDVSFTYPGADSPALQHVSLTIRPGEKIGIIGKIGAGKTTLLRLLTRLYVPETGNILIDQHHLAQFHPGELRRHIGCMTQEPTLFFGTIRDNILLGRQHVSESDLTRACKLSGVALFTQSSPSGLNRQVGENGQCLSGGQKQAIAFARAIVSQPPLLILDEPTSSMDNRAEQQIKHTIADMERDTTLLLLTHKTTMLDVVDRLIVLEQGKIIADGPKDIILSKLK
ncbi:ABC transporter [Photobacterium aquae]|uniref:ABC transporter n=1 Tax=Photobacterium aquae TaxID=1195763 RepID=A0A0J1H134_9GAMM|nr:type I secretion system permease/ATPase [Photobacterium aquae]KLV05531.1 ABC transporter [Photobacterium aquae]